MLIFLDQSLAQHLAKLYHLTNDPGEEQNLINHPVYAGQLKELQKQLARLEQQAGPGTVKMPRDEGIKTTLPEKSIR